MAIAAAFDLCAILVEHVRLGDDLKLCGGKPEAFRELTDRNEHRDVQELVGAVDQHAPQAVLRKQLGRSLGAPFGAGDEEHGVAALAHPLDLGDPFLNAPAEFNGRLTGDVERTVRREAGHYRRWCRRSSIANCSNLVAVVNRSATSFPRQRAMLPASAPLGFSSFASS